MKISASIIDFSEARLAALAKRVERELILLDWGVAPSRGARPRGADGASPAGEERSPPREVVFLR